MRTALRLKPVTVMANIDHWKAFTALAHSRGSNISTLLRQMVQRELRNAARQTASGK